MLAVHMFGRTSLHGQKDDYKTLLCYATLIRHGVHNCVRKLLEFFCDASHFGEFKSPATRLREV